MAKPINVLMIFPKFSGNSFWSYKATCELVGAKHPAPPLGLITVAAMLPSNWVVRLLDRNIEDVKDDDIHWADIVMTGGMLPQQIDSLFIVNWAHDMGKRVVVGGPDVSSTPDVYAAADFRVVGEAEEIMDKVIEAIDSGKTTGLFVAPLHKTDITKSPLPRFDLVKTAKYTQMCIQFSRGCPFLCEFCDIIELYGRRPRTKHVEQFLIEFDALYRMGYRGHIDIVDDNLIGNKKAVKSMLKKLIGWQRQHGYPFSFTTEASLNLADDDEMLALMKEAGFFAVFIGIESPDENVLARIRKKQNIKHDTTEQIYKIYKSGMFVLGGFIVGFDDEHGNVSEGILSLVENACIPISMVGLLYALPNTQLTRRLIEEGRLHEPDHTYLKDGRTSDQCTEGLNFETKRPRRDILRDYLNIISTLYQPEAYCKRVLGVVKNMNMDGPPGRLYVSRMRRELPEFAQLLWAFTFRQPRLRGIFWRTLIEAARHNPKTIKPVIIMLAMYIHLGPFSDFVAQEIEKQLGEGDVSAKYVEQGVIQAVS